jgi:hypothetical protein
VHLPRAPMLEVILRERSILILWFALRLYVGLPRVHVFACVCVCLHVFACVCIGSHVVYTCFALASVGWTRLQADSGFVEEDDPDGHHLNA